MLVQLCQDADRLVTVSTARVGPKAAERSFLVSNAVLPMRKGMPGILRRHQYRQVLGAPRLHEVQHLRLIGEVEMRGGLVEDQQPRLS